MSEAKRRTRLIIEMKRADSIVVQFGSEEVEIALHPNNPSNKARLCFQAPKSVEILRLEGSDADES